MRIPITIVAQAWAPDSGCLATGSRRGVIKLRAAGPDGTVRTIQAHTAAIRSLLWSRDSQRLASSAEDGTAKVWNRDRGEELMKFEAAIWPGGDGKYRLPPNVRQPAATNLAWSPDGDRLAVAEDNGIIRIWDTVSRQEVHTLHGHSGPVGLTWNPRFGERLVSGATEEIKIWDTATGQELVALPLQSVRGPSPASRLPVAWSRDGWRLQAWIPAAIGAPVTVWDATPSDPMK